MKEAFFAQTSVIILSAGSSVRMGTHKALLRFDDDRTFLQKITETYVSAAFEQIIVVVNAELYKLISENKTALSEKVMLVVNDKPALGRFYSLQTGIKPLKTGNYCFFQNIDNPFTSESLLEELINFKTQADVIMPVFENKSGHPVLVNGFVAGQIQNNTDMEIRIDTFLSKFKTLRVETKDAGILSNLNSRSEFLAAGFSGFSDASS